MENHPEYQISSAVNDGILEIIIGGKITKDFIGQLDNDVYSIIKSTNSRKLLVDIRPLKGRLGIADSFFHAKDYPSGFHGIQSAIVDLPENADFQSFVENVKSNIGISSKWFTDIEVARDWIKSK
ncbi:MAG: hypothetical protein ACYDGO_01760 [Smithellaceae bacterium]